LSPLFNLQGENHWSSRPSYQLQKKHTTTGHKKCNKPMRYAPFPFLALAIAFIAIGATGQRTFIYVGIVFLVLAIVMMRKRRNVTRR
jgi:LPXTG-motif cell wall-anchored protein